MAHISKEANEVLNSLEKRLSDLENEPNVSNPENDTLIKASTKRDVTLRFIKSIEEEQEHRKNNPALRDAASESLPRTFLEVARHRTVKIMDIPSSNTNASLVVSIDSSDDSKNDSI